MQDKNIIDLIESQRNTSFYSKVKTRSDNIFAIDKKILMIKEIVLDDRRSGSSLIQEYTNLINEIGSKEVLFFDEYFANVCLAVFHLKNKTKDFRNDIRNACKDFNQQIIKEYEVKNSGEEY